MKSLCGAILLALVATTATAQSSTDNRLQSDIIIEELRLQAAEFTGDIDGLVAKFKELPKDLEGAVELYDEMIAAVEAMLAKVGDDTPLAESVAQFRVEAEKYRDEWRARCESTKSSRDCARIELWGQRVDKALAAEDRYTSLIAGIQDSMKIVQENKVYAVDDLRLQLFDAALESLNVSLDELEKIHKAMSDLAVSAGGDPLPKVERQTEG